MKDDRRARAYRRQAAAIAAKLATPKPAPCADGPVRLGVHVRLKRRVLIGPKVIDVIRANRRDAQRNERRGRVA